MSSAVSLVPDLLLLSLVALKDLNLCLLSPQTSPCCCRINLLGALGCIMFLIERQDPKFLHLGQKPALRALTQVLLYLGSPNCKMMVVVHVIQNISISYAELAQLSSELLSYQFRVNALILLEKLFMFTPLHNTKMYESWLKAVVSVSVMKRMLELHSGRDKKQGSIFYSLEILYFPLGITVQFWTLSYLCQFSFLAPLFMYIHPLFLLICYVCVLKYLHNATHISDNSFFSPEFLSSTLDESGVESLSINNVICNSGLKHIFTSSPHPPSKNTSHLPEERMVCDSSTSFAFPAVIFHFSPIYTYRMHHLSVIDLMCRLFSVRAFWHPKLFVDKANRTEMSHSGQMCPRGAVWYDTDSKCTEWSL